MTVIFIFYFFAGKVNGIRSQFKPGTFQSVQVSQPTPLSEFYPLSMTDLPDIVCICALLHAQLIFVANEVLLITSTSCPLSACLYLLCACQIFLKQSLSSFCFKTSPQIPPFQTFTAHFETSINLLNP